MNNQEITLNFGGFYGSIHEGQLEHVIQCYTDTFDTRIEPIKECDITKTWLNYCKDYLKLVEQFLLKEKIAIKIDFVKLDSPKYYNFETDKIIAKINLEHRQKIIDFVKTKFADDLFELIIKITTRVSGYIPFYTYDNIFIENKNNTLLEACLEVICNEVNKDELPFGFELEYLPQ